MPAAGAALVVVVAMTYFSDEPLRRHLEGSMNRSLTGYSVSVGHAHLNMRRMNDLMKACGKFDVTSGLFSFFCQLEVKDVMIDGYIRPLFRDLKVYEARQDAEENIFRKLYEQLVGGLAKLLENHKGGEVATKTRVAGKLGNVRTNTLELVLRLFENAFLSATLPGFDKELARISGVRKPPGKTAK